MNTQFPDHIELNVGIQEEDGKIINVGPYRHRVDWKQSSCSTITYCNNCGTGFVTEGSVQVQETTRVIHQCPVCKVFQGFVY